MPEIIILFFLCRKMGNLAVQKGLSAITWKLYTILGFFAAEIVGIMLGILLFGNIDVNALSTMAELQNSNIYGLEAFALISAFGGYLIVKSILEKKPDTLDEDINKISINDLRPPQKN